MEERINAAKMAKLLAILRKLSMENISGILNTSLPTPSHGQPVSTAEAFRIAAPAAMMIDRIVTPIWYVIGIIGNPITMKIWLSKRMRESNSSAIYIGSIAIVHFIFIWLHLLLELHIAWGISTYNKPTLCEIFNFLYIIPQYLAPLLILGFTTERYIAVCLPFKKEQFCTVRRACIVVFVLTVFSFLLGSVQMYMWTFNVERQLCYYRKGAKPFYVIWTWISEMLIFAVVPLLVLIFNILVIREIKLLTRRASFRMHRDSNNRGNANQTSTVTLLSVSFYLICTLLPATIVYAMQSVIKTGEHTIPYNKWSEDPQWQKYLIYFTIRKIVEEITFSNYACYVFIYYITGSYFRTEVHKILCFRLCRNKSKRDVQRTSTKTSTHAEQYTLITTNGKQEICQTETASVAV
ncbi:growth hormone secretagogue receptor type 1-like isoform X4 [Ruditapes philippinarum]|uniref:growth hormone secretagogue receptor type 1-like isoform X4 n=1 Tax=Ruditapes philippinarum TaxID=129788 RepID=UPI00295AE3E2|nr:growth hormone secretagogue receptor type 1-like isoform X4 [Ruditapes philippinarum]